MPYVLGIDLGTSDTAAAVCPLDGTGAPEIAPRIVPRIVPLGERAPVLATALLVRPDGSVTAADGPHGGHRRGGAVATGFVARVGDEVPQVVAGQQYLPQDLAAALAAWVVDRASAMYGAPPEHVVLTHPAGWGPHRHALFRQALQRHRLAGVSLVPAPVAAAHACGLAGSGPVAVLDVRADTVEASVVAVRPTGTFEPIGRAESVDAPAGALFDGSPDEPVEPTIGVWVDALARTVRSAGAQPGTVLLVGGPCRMPAVARLAGERLSCRPVVEPDPELTVARGAALAALAATRPAQHGSLARQGPSGQHGSLAQHGSPGQHGPSGQHGPLDGRRPGGSGDVPAARPVGVGIRPATGAFAEPPPRPPVDISSPDLAPPRSLTQLVGGRPLVLAAALSAVAVVGVTLTLVFMPGDDVGGATTPTPPPAAGVPQPGGGTEGPGR